MGTQAVVSLVRDGETIIKVIAGCNGCNATKLADAIRDGSLYDCNEIHGAAREVNFGCRSCLVIQDVSGEIYMGDGELPPEYRLRFNEPKFNPRWKSGEAEHVVLVDTGS